MGTVVEHKAAERRYEDAVTEGAVASASFNPVIPAGQAERPRPRLEAAARRYSQRREASDVG